MTNLPTLAELAQQQEQAEALATTINELDVSSATIAKMLQQQYENIINIESIESYTAQHEIIADAIAGFRVLGEQSLKDMNELESIMDETQRALDNGYLSTDIGLQFIQAAKLTRSNLALGITLSKEIDRITE